MCGNAIYIFDIFSTSYNKKQTRHPDDYVAESNQNEMINNLKNVKHYHLKVIIDNVTKTLIYDRKLSEGSGSSVYGLEVCK